MSARPDPEAQRGAPAPRPEASAVNRVGKYEIVREIGKGATSTVYLGVDPFTRREVAVKVFRTEVMRNPSRGRLVKKLFLTEASLAGKLSHPHIAAIYDAVAEDDSSYIVMEYVPGSTLERFCDVDNLLPFGRVVEIVYKCCKALEYAHRMGVIHRDIKPANILLGGDTEIKISDFGSAITSQTQQTTQISAVGSPAYMSPQQVKEHPLNHQTDIYSLGVAMYKLLTGRLPFNATNNYSMIYQILNASPLPPSAFRPELPAPLDRIVQRAMEKDLELRYQSWDEFARDLVEAFGQLDHGNHGMSDSERFDTLRDMRFFRNFTDVELWEVLRITLWGRHPAGHALIREGDPGRSFYVLASGEVKVTKQGRLLSMLTPGDCFGEMSYLARREFTRSASVTAVTDITVIEIRSEMLERGSEGCKHQFNGAFLEILVDRLALANTRMSQLLAERNITIY